MTICIKHKVLSFGSCPACEYDAEVEEFNSGHEAFMRGEPIENEYMYSTKHDVWRTGWVWAQWVKGKTE